MLGPVAAAFVHLLLSPKREFDADRAGPATRSPHPLADALVRLDEAAELVQFEASVAEPVYIMNPFEEEGLAALLSPILRSVSGEAPAGSSFATHPVLAA